MISDFLSGFLSGATLILAIGAQNSFVLRQGIRNEHIVPVVLVCSCADALLIMAGVAGLGLLIQSNPAVLTFARYGGAIFLAAYGIAAGKRALQSNRLVVNAEIGASLGTAIATCLSFTFLNPHVYLDTVILLGSLANQRQGTGRWIFGLGGSMASFAWFFALGFGARKLAPLFSKAIAWRLLDTAIAISMIGLSMMLFIG